MQENFSFWTGILISDSEKRDRKKQRISTSMRSKNLMICVTMLASDYSKRLRSPANLTKHWPAYMKVSKKRVQGQQLIFLKFLTQKGVSTIFLKTSKFWFVFLSRTSRKGKSLLCGQNFLSSQEENKSSLLKNLCSDGRCAGEQGNFKHSAQENSKHFFHLRKLNISLCKWSSRFLTKVDN